MSKGVKRKRKRKRKEYILSRWKQVQQRIISLLFYPLCCKQYQLIDSNSADSQSPINPHPSLSSSLVPHGLTFQKSHHKKMPEPEEEYRRYFPLKYVTTPAPTSAPPHAVVDRESPMMDLDLDLDASWPFDQIFGSNPMSPFVISNSEQPCSPLWAFSDDNAEKVSGNVTGSLHISEYPRLLSCNPDCGAEKTSGNDDKRRAPPILGLMPLDYPDVSYVIKERMIQALRYFKESTEQHVLAQVWAPVKNGGRYVLTTSGQPFVLDPSSNGLHQYRMVSLMYMFPVDEESDGVLGLPGRVFRQKLPEWTPDVQYYSSKEYPRLNHAQHYNVRGTLALPVFEPSGQSCVGVLELIMTSQKINYAPEVDKVCKALEAVNLKSSNILDHPNTQICNEGRQNALVKILEILTVVCETHKLPLAQTWVPCRHRSILAYGGGLKKSCSSFDGSCMGQVCMSPTDVAFYVVDAHMWGFREACAEHHLQKGQGVVGRAFSSHGSCFCEDVTKFCKTEYPLVHYARMFGLISCFAICLRSTYTGNDDYVLEFFLPPDIIDREDQRAFLNSMLGTMNLHLESLRVASGKELMEVGRSMEIIKASSIDEKIDLIPNGVEIAELNLKSSPPEHEQIPIGVEIARLNSLEQQLIMDVGFAVGNQNAATTVEIKDANKKLERKRGKAEKSISLEVLQQYFTGSLKDAAKSLGVCPTTMKRICRQHGISRWPSRKINKVNRSLSKLKRVIESVEGAEGAFTLSSLASTSLPINVSSISWPAGMNGCDQHHSPVSKSPEQPSKLSENADEMQTKCEKTNPLQNGSKTGSGSREESIGTPTSHGSCQGSPCIGTESSPQNDHVVSPTNEPQPTGEQNLSLFFSIPQTLVVPQSEEPFGGMLLEDAGSSHDLRNLCPENSWTNASCLKPVPKDSIPAATSDRMLNFTFRPEVKTLTIKATYREDIIRFRLSMDSGITKLKEEVAKRLKLEMGTFDIKYLDDDHEWVLIACDADLQECVDILTLSGNNIIRLLVHDIMSNFGSSCESSGEY